MFLDKPFQAVGGVPLWRVLQELERQEVVLWHPPVRASQVVAWSAQGTVRVRDAIAAVESAEGWVFDPTNKRFGVAQATHSVDSPDAFGRVSPGADRAPLTRRGALSVSFRFRQLSAGLQADGASLLGTLEEFSGTLPDGVRKSFEVTQERTYFNGVNTTGASTVVTVNTELQTRQAGMQFDVLAGRLPGMSFRLEGTLSVSAFSGSDLSRSVVSLPVDVDGKRGEWVHLCRIRGVDASVQALFKGFKVSGGGEVDGVDLEVRVD
jgi:hypothetical protein